MARLIDADALEFRFEYGCNDDGLLLVPYRDIKKAIDSASTVNVVEVVHCKDCVHMEKQSCGRYCKVWGTYNGYGDYGYCNYGERKDNE